MLRPSIGSEGAPPSAALAGAIMALASGAAALAHQIIWTRRMIDLLGANTDVFARVVGTFFAGLALGGLWAAHRPGAAETAWKRVACAELGVAVLSLPVLFSFNLAESLSGASTTGPVLRWGLPVLLITPPAFAMGTVLPWLIRALSRLEGSLPRGTVLLYALNTLGGVVGCIGAAFFLLPAWGLTGSGLWAAGLNVIAAITAIGLAPHQSRPSKPVQQAAPTRPRPSEGLVAIGSGWAILTLEVLVQHQLTQVTVNSLFSSAWVLVLVLVSLGVAALAVPWISKLKANGLRVTVLLCAAFMCLAQPFLLTGLQGGLVMLSYDLTPVPYLLELAQLGLVGVMPVFLIGGLVFPLLLRDVLTLRPGQACPEAGRLLAYNGLGGWIGAETTQAWVAPALGLWRSMAVPATLYVLLALLLWSRRPGRLRWFAWPWLGVVALVLIGLGTSWLDRLPQAHLAPEERLAALEVGREGVVATVAASPEDWRMLHNNSYTLGGSKAWSNQERQAILPLLVHASAARVATLGIATGSTVAGAGLIPSVTQIDAVELSSLVLDQARQFFGPFNRRILEDARVHCQVEDARWAVARAEAAYDVVLGDLFLPWRTGEARLYSLEHFANVRRALKPGGVFCQWLPLFQLTAPQFQAILRTFREVFPEVWLLRGDFYTELPIVGLVGGRALNEVDWKAVARVCDQVRHQARVTDPIIRHPQGLAMMILGPPPDPGPGPINTLANSWIEWDASRNILGLNTPWFIGIPCAKYFREIQRDSAKLLPEELRPAHDAGQFFLTLEIAAKLNLEALPGLLSQINQRLPEQLGKDQEADWQQWPSRCKPAPQSEPSKARFP